MGLRLGGGQVDARCSGRQVVKAWWRPGCQVEGRWRSEYRLDGGQVETRRRSGAKGLVEVGWSIGM